MTLEDAYYARDVLAEKFYDTPSSLKVIIDGKAAELAIEALEAHIKELRHWPELRALDEAIAYVDCMRDEYASCDVEVVNALDTVLLCLRNIKDKYKERQ